MSNLYIIGLCQEMERRTNSSDIVQRATSLGEPMDFIALSKKPDLQVTIKYRDENNKECTLSDVAVYQLFYQPYYFSNKIKNRTPTISLATKDSKKTHLHDDVLIRIPVDSILTFTKRIDDVKSQVQLPVTFSTGSTSTRNIQDGQADGINQPTPPSRPGGRRL